MPDLRVVSVGLGPIGIEVLRYAAARPEIEIVGAVDIDPGKAGRSLRDVAGVDRDLTVSLTLDDALMGRTADAVLHSTVSSLPAAMEGLAPALRHGLSVVSTCEELSYPWRTQPGAARELDEKARAAGVAVLGTGVNPGFVMDVLPLVLTSACQEVRRVEVERIVDAGNRRAPLQRKVGAGLTPEQFDELVRKGSVRHVGLTESAWMILDALGWAPDEFEETIEPVLAEREIVIEASTVQPGQVAGVRQVLRVSTAGEEKLRLELRMYIGAEAPCDRIRISGVPDLDIQIVGGVHGDRATAAVAVNSLLAMGEETGLLTMLDLLRVRAR